MSSNVGVEYVVIINGRGVAFEADEVGGRGRNI